MVLRMDGVSSAAEIIKPLCNFIRSRIDVRRKSNLPDSIQSIMNGNNPVQIAIVGWKCRNVSYKFV